MTDLRVLDDRIVIVERPRFMIVPVVIVDLSAGRDGAGLAGVLVEERGHWVAGRWRDCTPTSTAIACTVTRPVRRYFRLAFALPQDRAILRYIVSAGMVVVADRPPRQQAERSIDLPGLYSRLPEPPATLNAALGAADGAAEWDVARFALADVWANTRRWAILRSLGEHWLRERPKSESVTCRLGTAPAGDRDPRPARR